MYEDIKSGTGFINALFSFSSQLVIKELALYDVEFHSLCFGSFSVVFGKRKSRYKAQWDGREFFLDLFQGDFPDSQSPKDWKHLKNKRINPAPYETIFEEILNEIK